MEGLCRASGRLDRSSSTTRGRHAVFCFSSRSTFPRICTRTLAEPVTGIAPGLLSLGLAHGPQAEPDRWPLRWRLLSGDESDVNARDLVRGHRYDASLARLGSHVAEFEDDSGRDNAYVRWPKGVAVAQTNLGDGSEAVRGVPRLHRAHQSIDERPDRIRGDVVVRRLHLAELVLDLALDLGDFCLDGVALPPLTYAFVATLWALRVAQNAMPGFGR